MAMLVSDEVDFRENKIMKDTEGHYTMIKMVISTKINQVILQLFHQATELQNIWSKKLMEIKGHEQVDNY